MEKPTFTWHPDLGSESSDEPLVTVTKFGDGYEARLPTSINSMPVKWSLTFTTTLAKYQEIKAFLNKRGGVEAFNWTTPDNDTGLFVCRSWKRKQSKFGVYQITATFEQVFE